MGLGCRILTKTLSNYLRPTDVHSDGRVRKPTVLSTRSSCPLNPGLGPGPTIHQWGGYSNTVTENPVDDRVPSGPRPIKD